MFNQFTEVFSVLELANIVKKAGETLGLSVKIDHLENPRIESEDHHFNPRNDALLKLGLKPSLLSDELVNSMLVKIKESKHLIDNATVLPKVKWKQ